MNDKDIKRDFKNIIKINSEIIKSLKIVSKINKNTIIKKYNDDAIHMLSAINIYLKIQIKG